MENLARQRLLQLQRELHARRSMTRLIAVVVVAIISVESYLLFNLFIEDLLDQSGLVYWSALSVLGVNFAACLVVPCFVVPRWEDAVWRRHYARMLRFIRCTDAIHWVLEAERWERVRELEQQYPWYKLLSVPANAALLRQVAYAARRWRSLTVLVRSGPGLERALQRDGLAQVAELIFGSEGAVLNAVLAVLVCTAFLPSVVLLLVMLVWHVEIRATQAALIEQLLDHPLSPGLAPVPADYGSQPAALQDERPVSASRPQQRRRERR